MTTELGRLARGHVRQRRAVQRALSVYLELVPPGDLCC